MSEIKFDTMTVRKQIQLPMNTWWLAVQAEIRLQELVYFNINYMKYCMNIEEDEYNTGEYILDLCPLDKKNEEIDNERICLHLDNEEMAAFVEKFAMEPNKMFDWADKLYFQRAKKHLE